MEVDEKYWSIISKRISESQFPSELVELVSHDDQRFPIRLDILTAASGYFAASFGPNWNLQKGNRTKRGWLEGVYSDTLRMIVNYCNTGHIELTEENVRTFLGIASYYQLDLLEEKCRSFYAGVLSIPNSVDALMIAHELSYPELRQAALDLICENFESVPTTDVQKLDHQLFGEILKSDEITSSEDLIFDRLLKWFEHEEKERKPYVPNLLKLIRLKHIKLEILRDTVEAFYEKFGCGELIRAEYSRRSSGDPFDSGFRRYPSLFYVFNERGWGSIQVGRLETASRNRENIGYLIVKERLNAQMVLNQNKIYALGGGLKYATFNTVSSFDLNSPKEEILSEMSIRRKCCTSIVFGDYIYVFGGWNNSGWLSSCERFDIKRKTWTEIASMNVARSGASAVVLDGCIYTAGGDDGERRSTFESYDPMRNVWKQLAPMKYSRSKFALIRLNGFIYAIGHRDNIEKYDPSKNQWTEISRLGGSASITSGINVNGDIYVIKINGVIRRIKIDESDNCSFFPWTVKTGYGSLYPGNHLLSLN